MMRINNMMQADKQIAKGDKEYKRICDCLYGIRSKGADKLHASHNIGHIWVKDNVKADFRTGLPAGIGLIIDDPERWVNPPEPSSDMVEDVSRMIGRELQHVKTMRVGDGKYSYCFAVLASNMIAREGRSSVPQYIGKGTGVDWSQENKVFSQMLARHGIKKFSVEMANPYCAEVSIPLVSDREDVRDFANDLFHELGLLAGDVDLEFGQQTDCCVLDINDAVRSYLVVLNHHDIKDCEHGDAMYKYKVEAICSECGCGEHAGSEDSVNGELTPDQIMMCLSNAIKSGEIRSRTGEGFFILTCEYYDDIKAGRKTTEYRDISPRNLAKSIGIKAVKFQRGYEKVQMRYEVKSVGLLDADGRECDPYNIPPGFFATTIAIHLGKRIG